MFRVAQVVDYDRVYVRESWDPFAFSPQPPSDIRRQYAPSAWMTVWKVRAKM
jgi:hypothetical protein